MRYIEEYWIPALIVVILIAVFAALLGECHNQRKCEQAGGSVEHYNFRTVLMPMSCGDGCVMMIPTETSDWRCVGLKAERP